MTLTGPMTERNRQFVRRRHYRQQRQRHVDCRDRERHPRRRGGAVTYEIDAGGANVTIANSGSNDTLAFGAGITESDLTATSALVDGTTVVTITDSQGGSVSILGGSLNQHQLCRWQ